MNQLARPSVSATRSVLSGSSALRNLLNSERHLISRAPVLVISSQVDANAPNTVSVEQVDHVCRKVEFATSMQSGLRTISSHITSAFPMTQDVLSRIDLVQRTGCSTVLGVGSGAAMDLAKSVIEGLQSSHHEDVRGILVPSTYGAALASTSSHSLLWDPSQEGLVARDAGSINDHTTVILDSSSLAKLAPSDAAHASLAIAMDALLRKSDSPDVATTLEFAFGALKDENDGASEAVAHAGSLLSFGMEDTRSVPLALATSLLPTAFPSSSVLTFVAALLPGLCHVAGSSELEELIVRHCQRDAHRIPALAALVQQSDAALSVSTLLSHVRENQAAWNCLDADPQVLEAVLQYSLNR